MFEMNKYYLCKECKEVNNEELNAFIEKVFHNNSYREYLRFNSCENGNYNYYDYEPPMMKFRVGGIYKCMMDNYLKDDNGKLVYIGELDGFLFEEVKIDLHGCEKIIGAIENHHWCSASVEPFAVNDGISITYICNVKLGSVNRKFIATSHTFSENPVNGLLAAYREARKTLAKWGKLNKAIHNKYPYNQCAK